MESDHLATPEFSHFFDYAQLTDKQRAFITEAGHFWRTARTQDGVARGAVGGIALRAQLALFENGLLQPDVYISGEFPELYAKALGKPELLDEYRQRFGLVQDEPSA